MGSNCLCGAENKGENTREQLRKEETILKITKKKEEETMDSVYNARENMNKIDQFLKRFELQKSDEESASLIEGVDFTESIMQDFGTMVKSLLLKAENENKKIIDIIDEDTSEKNK